MSGWWLLGAAIVCEVTATTALMFSHGLSRPAATLVAVLGYAVSYGCLAYALKAGLDLPVAYAVWSAVGTAALTVVGAVVFGEHVGPVKLAALGLIIGGVLLLHLPGPPAALRTTTGAVPPAAGPRDRPPAPTSKADLS